MRYFAVALIFWLSVWTAPKASSWWVRPIIIAWGFYLCQKILGDTPEKK